MVSPYLFLNKPNDFSVIIAQYGPHDDGRRLGRGIKGSIGWIIGRFVLLFQGFCRGLVLWLVTDLVLHLIAQFILLSFFYCCLSLFLVLLHLLLCLSLLLKLLKVLIDIRLFLRNFLRFRNLARVFLRFAKY